MNIFRKLNLICVVSISLFALAACSKGERDNSRASEQPLLGYAYDPMPDVKEPTIFFDIENRSDEFICISEWDIRERAQALSIFQNGKDVSVDKDQGNPGDLFYKGTLFSAPYLIIPPKTPSGIIMSFKGWNIPPGPAIVKLDLPYAYCSELLDARKDATQAKFYIHTIESKYTVK
jgi:hypothetical protein